MNSTQQSYTWKQFLPLIIIMGAVVLTTIAVASYQNSWSMHAIMRYGMGSFFIIFGLFKVINLTGFAKAYREYDLVAQRWYFYGLLYPFIELAIGVAYYANWYPREVSMITLVLMLVSAAGVYRELRKNKPIVCACLGAVFKIPMTYVTLGEDLLMSVMATLMLLS